MIEASELHRYFMVRYIPTDVEVWLMNGDVRYEATDPYWGYRIAADGDRILVTRGGLPRNWGFPARLDEVEPLPDGRGLYHPDWADSRALGLSMTYEGSWRQYADQQATAA